MSDSYLPLKFTLPDGTKIEVTVSDTYSGPDGKPGCQRTSRNAVWYKIDGQDRWQPTSQRSLHRITEWISVCENVEDFLSGEK